MTTLIAWARTKSDSRNTASAIHSFSVVHGTPAELAREIDTYGDSAVRELIESGHIVAAPENEHFGGSGARVAAGHGVTVKYSSGRIRTYRGA